MIQISDPAGVDVARGPGKEIFRGRVSTQTLAVGFQHDEFAGKRSGGGHRPGKGFLARAASDGTVMKVGIPSCSGAPLVAKHQNNLSFRIGQPSARRTDLPERTLSCAGTHSQRNLRPSRASLRRNRKKLP